MRTRLILAGVLALAATAVTTPWVSSHALIPGRLWLAPIEAVTIAGHDLRLVRVRYSQGLRDVESLGSLDGALFVLGGPASVDHGMGMDRARMPLDVVFFDPSGMFVTRHTMPVCEDEDCPAFYSTRPWQFAIEGPAGSLSWVPDNAQLVR